MNAPGVLISIKPNWVEQILSGHKTVEIRKTLPRWATPFKVYIYCTLSGNEVWKDGVKLNGKVVGQFICYHVEILPMKTYHEWLSHIAAKGCISPDKLWAYGQGKELLYGWQISDVVQYEHPLPLESFKYWPSGSQCSGGGPQNISYVKKLR